MFFDATPAVFEKAKILRQNLTNTEKMLWNELKNKKLNVKFRRQHPISHYVVDFYCHQFRLVIEIDGDYHQKASQKIEDEDRQKDLCSFGLNVIRFTDEQVINNLGEVLLEIKKAISPSTPTP